MDVCDSILSLRIVSNRFTVQGALQWLEDNQDKSLEEINTPAPKAAAGSDDEDSGPALNPGEEAKSMICNDCGKKFRSVAQAEFHASKTWVPIYRGVIRQLLMVE